MPTNTMQNRHILEFLPSLHRSLIELVSAMNQPERDAAMLEAAGLKLERALFPLLVAIERLGPIGVGNLAGGVGRDHTTVSRQVARLEALGLVQRQAGAVDRRVREAVITRQGKLATDAVDRASERMALELFKDWSAEEFDALVRLTRRLAEGMRGGPAPAAPDSDDA